MEKVFDQPDESINKLWAYCSPEHETAGEMYNEIKSALIRFFELKGDSDPISAADQTMDRAALKLSQNIQVENLQSYCFGIARFIFLERLKSVKKSKAAAEEFYKSTESFPNAEENNHSFFRECFDSLNETEKNLLTNYFADLPFSKLDEYRRQMCIEKNLSLNNLRIKIFRLRRRLEDCLKNKLK